MSFESARKPQMEVGNIGEEASHPSPFRVDVTNGRSVEGSQQRDIVRGKGKEKGAVDIAGVRAAESCAMKGERCADSTLSNGFEQAVNRAVVMHEMTHHADSIRGMKGGRKLACIGGLGGHGFFDEYVQSCL
jgi:hypothetical protein